MNEEEIFHEALARGLPEERAVYLEQACAGNVALRESVEALLRANVGASEFLNRPAPEMEPTLVRHCTESPGTIIGPYKLLEQIGEGGFGIVFMADQQAPVRRRVALKIIKPGMDTKQVLARFKAELQALSLMDHPNIARVLDAGSTDAGRPYFVMELVRGVPITDYCDANNLALHERLDLFVQVCHAVQHAHQKGIIHRDIKPSNVLVTVQDGRPVPKVIDFGVAKAINQQLTQETIFTRFAEMIGTPLYMSPEQAEMTSLDIDTRSDIYSLGVLLYELLTGTTPFSRDRLRKAGHAEICRIIREEEPAKPSTRISTLGDGTAVVAAHRHSDPRQLGQMMQGDLDWIVMKALEKDRTRRYETANAMAMDLQRHLADEPVLAGPPSAAYRFRKFAKRNRSALTMATLVSVALLLGIVGTTWQAIRAMSERDRAVIAEATERKARAEEAEQRREAESQRAQAEANLQKARAAVDEYFTLVSESKLFEIPGLQPLRKELLDAALRYYDEFLSQRSNDPKVRVELAAVRLRVAQVYNQNNRPDDAVDNLKHGLDIIERLVQDAPNVPEFPRQLAGIFKGGRILTFWTLWPHNTPEAVNVYQRAAELWERFVKENPDQPGFQSDLAFLYRHVGDLQTHLNENATALTFFQRSCRIWEALVESDPAQPEYRSGLADSLEYVAIALRETGRHQERKSVSLQALALREKLVADFPKVADYRAGLANAYRRLGGVVMAAGDRADAEKAYTRALEAWEQLAAEFPTVSGYRKQHANAYMHLGSVLRASGQSYEAATAYRNAFEILLPLSAESPGERGDNLIELRDSLVQLSDLLKKTNREQEAADANERFIAVLKPLVERFPSDGASRDFVDQYYQSLGTIHLANGRRDDALTAFRTGAEKMSLLVAEFPAVASYREAVGHQSRRLAFALSDTTEAQEKEAALRKAMQVFEQLSAEFPKNSRYPALLADTQKIFSWFLSSKKRHDEAFEAFQQTIVTYERLIASFPAEHARELELANCHNDFATALKHAGRFAEAEQGYRKAVALKAKLVADSPQNAGYRFHLAHSHQGLAYLLSDMGRKAEAEAAYRDAIAVWSQLVIESPSNADYRLNLAHNVRAIAQLLSESGRKAESEVAFHEALTQWEKLVADSPGIAHYRWNQAGCREALAGLLAELGRKAEAESTYRDALAIWENLVAESPTNVDYNWHLAVANDKLGLLLKELERFQEAIEALRRALPIWERISAETHSDDHRMHLSWTRGWLVESLTARAKQLENGEKPSEADRKAAVEAYLDAIAALEKQTVEAPENEGDRSKLSYILWQIGDARAALGQRDEAEKAYRNALSIFEKLSVDFSANAFYRFEQGFSHWKIGDLLKGASRLPEAAESYRHALAIYAKLSAEDLDNAEYRSRWARSHVMLIEVLLEQRRHADAAALAIALLAVDSDMWDARELATGYLVRCAALAREDESLPASERQPVADSYIKQAEKIPAKGNAPGHSTPPDAGAISIEADGIQPKETPK